MWWPLLYSVVLIDIAQGACTDLYTAYTATDISPTTVQLHEVVLSPKAGDLICQLYCIGRDTIVVYHNGVELVDMTNLMYDGLFKKWTGKSTDGSRKEKDFGKDVIGVGCQLPQTTTTRGPICSDKYTVYLGQHDLKQEALSDNALMCTLTCSDKSILVVKMNGGVEAKGLSSVFFDATNWIGVRPDNTSIALGGAGLSVGCQPLDPNADTVCARYYKPYMNHYISPSTLSMRQEQMECGGASTLCTLTCTGNTRLIVSTNERNAPNLTNVFFDSTQWIGILSNGSKIALGPSGIEIGCIINPRCHPYASSITGIEYANWCKWVWGEQVECIEDPEEHLCTCGFLKMEWMCNATDADLDRWMEWMKTFDDRIIRRMYVDGWTAHASVQDIMPTIFALFSTQEKAEFSWALDEMIESVVYELDELDTRDVFTQVFDEQSGNCYTFNYANSTNDVNNDGIFHVRFAGQYRDFSAMLKFDTSEKFAWGSNNGMNLYIHQPGTPAKQGLRYSIKSGSSDTIGLKKSITKLVANCVSSKEELKGNYYNDGDYTTEGCYIACYQDKVLEQCGCMDVRFKKGSNDSYCPFTADECVQEVLAKNGWPTGSWPECVCPQACYQEYYTIRASWASFPLKGPACDNRTHGCPESNKEWARISIYMESLESEVFEEEWRMSLLDLISQTGGIAGLCFGVGIVAIIEILLLCGQMVLNLSGAI